MDLQQIHTVSNLLLNIQIYAIHKLPSAFKTFLKFDYFHKILLHFSIKFLNLYVLLNQILD